MKEHTAVELYIKQKVFSWGDRFTVMDAAGRDRYVVEGEIFTFGKKLHVYDLSGRELIYIEQELFSLLPRYRVYLDGHEAAEITREFTLLTPRYRIDGPDWEVGGDFFAHEYEIFCGDSSIASITKEWMTWGDTYALHIVRPEDELTALAVVLAIDAATENSGGVSISIGNN